MTLAPAAVTDPKQFEQLTKSIAQDMVSLAFHWQLYGDLRQSIDEFETEFNQSPAFWTLTIAAHRETVLYRLCRIYDQEHSAFGLRNWLVALSENPSFFESAPCRAKLAADIESVSAKDETVNKLVRLRNNSIAHRAVKPILSEEVSEAHCRMKTADVATLTKRATDVVNRYTTLLHRESNSTTIVGHDDYRRVLGAVRERLERMRSARQK